MTVAADDEFYNRADTFIDLANQHAVSAARDSVSASLMYSSARFNAWINATGHLSAESMREGKLERIAQCVAQYRTMLDENMDSYIRNFDDYMKPNE